MRCAEEMHLTSRPHAQNWGQWQGDGGWTTATLWQGCRRIGRQCSLQRARYSSEQDDGGNIRGHGWGYQVLLIMGREFQDTQERAGLGKGRCPPLRSWAMLIHIGLTTSLVQSWHISSNKYSASSFNYWNTTSQRTLINSTFQLLLILFHYLIITQLKVVELGFFLGPMEIMAAEDAWSFPER